MIDVQFQIIFKRFGQYIYIYIVVFAKKIKFELLTYGTQSIVPTTRLLL